MLHAYGALLLLVVLLTGVTRSLTGLQDAVQRVEDIQRKSMGYLSGPAYERMEKLPKISAPVIDMYASFGQLFLNGELGSCEPDALFPSLPCVIRTNGGRDAQLSTKTTTLLNDISGLKGESPFIRLLPNVSTVFAVGFVGEAQETFQWTWSFYDYLSGKVNKALNARESLQTDLVDRCSLGKAWVARVNDAGSYGRLPRADFAINVLHRDVGPDCDVADLRLSYVYYARDHGFLGGDSNKCLQNLVIRYNNYNETAYEAFLEEIHKYLFQDLTIYGMCMAFGKVSDDERVRRKEWVNKKLSTISNELLKSREVLKEACLRRWGTNNSVWWSNLACLPQQHVPTSKDVHSIVTHMMTSSGNAIDKLPGRDRPSRYKGLIKDVVRTGKGRYTKFADNGSIEGVMYLPYGEGDNGLYCALSWPDKTNPYTLKGCRASYFVKWTEHPTPPEVLRSRIAFIKDRSKEDALWNTIFDQYSDDLCKQLRTADTKLTRSGTYLGQTDSKESSGFTAILAVRCTNEFVWYELGWRYYAAAATTANDYVVSRANGGYSNSCGQLIFLP